MYSSQIILKVLKYSVTDKAPWLMQLKDFSRWKILGPSFLRYLALISFQRSIANTINNKLFRIYFEIEFINQERTRLFALNHAVCLTSWSVEGRTIELSINCNLFLIVNTMTTELLHATKLSPLKIFYTNKAPGLSLGCI